MTEVELIVQQYEQVMTGDAWHGDPVWTILSGISAECAAARPLASAHSIWQIVLHMSYWEDVATRRMTAPVKPDEELNFPKLPEVNEANWQKALARLRATGEAFSAALAGLDAARLDGITPGGKRTFRDDAYGVIQHHIYHAGQISLLKNACAASSRAGL